MTKLRPAACAALCITLVFFTNGVRAATPEDQRFGVRLGSFITDRNTATRLDSDALGPGTDLDLEDDLGLETSQTVFRVDAYVRLGERHRLDFSYFDLSRDASKTIVRQIQFGDEVFNIDAEVDADFEQTIIKAAYTYSLFRSPEGFLGVTAGLFVMDIKASLSQVSLGQTEAQDVTAPLPVIGLRGAYSLSERWALRGSAEIFALEYDDVDGQLVDFLAGVEYQVTDAVTVGLAYNDTTFDVDVGQSDFSGAVDWQYSGALLYVGIGFGSLSER